MNRCAALALLVLGLLVLSACTVDENGIRDPVSEAKAQATRTATDTNRKSAEIDLSIKEQTAYMEVKTKEAELKLRQTQAESEAKQNELRAQADAEAAVLLAQQTARAKADVLRAFGYAASVLVCIAGLAGAVWVSGVSFSRATNAWHNSKYVRIGVDPLTLQPPPLIITSDGFLVDTRSGERARLRDGAGVDRMRVAATTHSTNVAILARTAAELARAAKGQGGTDPDAVRIADVLPQLAGSVPMMSTSDPVS